MDFDRDDAKLCIVSFFSSNFLKYFSIFLVIVRMFPYLCKGMKMSIPTYLMFDFYN